METETVSTPISLNWFEMCRITLLHPTIKTFSRIVGDPKASLKWGLIWVAITASVVWLLGLQREILAGWIANVFGGRETFFYVSVIGTPIAAILGVLGLLIEAAIAHGLARLFKGAGTFHQLVFCWAVMQLPFILLAGLVMRFPLIFSPSRDFNLLRIILYTKMLVALGIYLYLLYAQVVAFSAVEKFGIGKGFSILILLAVVVSIAAACLSSGFQAVMANYFFRY